MTFFRPAAVALLACLACPLTVLAAGPGAEAVEAGLSWNLAFGHAGVRTGYDLHLGYRPDATSPLAAPVARLQVDDGAALTTLAGLPVAAHAWTARQSAADDAYDAGVQTKPWYTRGWVYWTLGGVAASVALSTAGSHSNQSESCSGTCNQQCANNTVSDCSGSLCVTDGICGPTGVTPGSGVGYAGQREAPEERAAEDESVDPHGGMGDLAEVQS